MNELSEISEYVDREYKNLERSKYRGRSLQGIWTKKKLLQDHLKDFEDILSQYENRVSTATWNRLTDTYEFVCTRVELSIKILDCTRVLPAKENKQRRNSDYIIEVVIPERIEDNFPDGDNSILSSTLLNGSHSESAHINGCESLKDLKNQIFQNSFELGSNHKGFKQEIEIIKADFINSSQKAENILKRMAYEFPMVTAMQCIPEFHGRSEQLKPFIIQVNYFSAGFPAEANQGPLLNVVYTKLRGEALRRLPEIEADSETEP